MDLRCSPLAWRIVRRPLLGIALVALGGSCRAESLIVPPELPPASQPLTPLATYEGWWRDVERCAGVTGNLDRVQWFVVRDADSFTYRGVRYDGYWWNMIHWIALADAKVDNAAVVRHEMLHDLLGRGDHPAVFFQNRCRDVVICNEDCRKDGG